MPEKVKYPTQTFNGSPNIGKNPKGVQHTLTYAYPVLNKTAKKKSDNISWTMH